MQEAVRTQMNHLTGRRTVKVAWFIFCLAVLAWWLVAFGMNSDITLTLRNESVIYIAIWMVVATFPIGIVWAALFAVGLSVLDDFGLSINSLFPIDSITLWLGFVLFGYVQWFIIAPRLVARLKAKQSRS